MYIYIYICIYIYIYIDLEHFGFDMGASENRVYPSKVILMINGDEDLAVLEVPPKKVFRIGWTPPCCTAAQFAMDQTSRCKENHRFRRSSNHFLKNEHVLTCINHIEPSIFWHYTPWIFCAHLCRPRS